MNELEKMQKREAIRRIKKLTKKFSLNSNMLDLFRDGLGGGVDFTERERSEEELKLLGLIIHNFKMEHNCIVYYFCINEVCCFNERWETLNIFFVSNNIEDWESERLCDNGDILVYSFNIDYPIFSEYGYIGLSSKDGDLIRTY